MSNKEWNVFRNNFALQEALNNQRVSFDIKGNLERVILSEEQFASIGSLELDGQKVHVGLKYLKPVSNEAALLQALGNPVPYFESERFQFDNAYANFIHFSITHPEHHDKFPKIFGLAISKTGYPLGVLVEDFSEGGTSEVIDLGKNASKPYMDLVSDFPQLYEAVHDAFLKGNHGVEGAISAVFIQKKGDKYKSKFVDTDQLFIHLSYHAKHGLMYITDLLMRQQPEVEIEFPITHIFKEQILLDYAQTTIDTIKRHGEIDDSQAVQMCRMGARGISSLQMRNVTNVLRVNGTIEAVDDPNSSHRVLYRIPQSEAGYERKLAL